MALVVLRWTLRVIRVVATFPFIAFSYLSIASTSDTAMEIATLVTGLMWWGSHLLLTRTALGTDADQIDDDERIHDGRF